MSLGTRNSSFDSDIETRNDLQYSSPASSINYYNNRERSAQRQNDLIGTSHSAPYSQPDFDDSGREPRDDFYKKRNCTLPTRSRSNYHYERGEHVRSSYQHSFSPRPRQHHREEQQNNLRSMRSDNQRYDGLAGEMQRVHLRNDDYRHRDRYNLQRNNKETSESRFFQIRTPISYHDEDAKRDYLQTHAIVEGSGVSVEPPVGYKPLATWDDKRLHPELQKIIKNRKYRAPTNIQQVAIPIIMNGNDIKCQSETGTGKTDTFLIPIINALITKKRHFTSSPYAMIVVQTLEAANQIYNEALVYCKNLGVTVFRSYGGIGMIQTNNEIEKGCDITIATVNRFIHLFESKTLFNDLLQYVVIDEVDEHLHQAINNLQKLLDISTYDTKVQFITVSATLSSSRCSFLGSAITIKAAALSNSRVNYKILPVQPDNQSRVNLLMQCLQIIRNDDPDSKVLIFRTDKQQVPTLAAHLTVNGLNAAALYGTQNLEIRTEAMNVFKKKDCNILVATTALSRAIDVMGLNCVINFDLPFHLRKEVFVQSGGRTGRFQKGIYITLFSPDDVPNGPTIASVIQEAKQPVPKFLTKTSLTAEDYSTTDAELKKLFETMPRHSVMPSQSSQGKAYNQDFRSSTEADIHAKSKPFENEFSQPLRSHATTPNSNSPIRQSTPVQYDMFSGFSTARVRVDNTHLNDIYAESDYSQPPDVAPTRLDLYSSEESFRTAKTHCRRSSLSSSSDDN